MKPSTIAKAISPLAVLLGASVASAHPGHGLAPGPVHDLVHSLARFDGLFALIGAIGLGIVAASFAEVRENGGGRVQFLTAFVHLFVMLSVFNVVDLVLLDWPLVAIVPRFMVLPGTEGSAGYKDYWFHFRGFLVGVVLILVASGLIAAVVAALL